MAQREKQFLFKYVKTSLGMVQCRKQNKTCKVFPWGKKPQLSCCIFLFTEINYYGAYRIVIVMQFHCEISTVYFNDTFKFATSAFCLESCYWWYASNTHKSEKKTIKKINYYITYLHLYSWEKKIRLLKISHFLCIY